MRASVLTASSYLRIFLALVVCCSLLSFPGSSFLSEVAAAIQGPNQNRSPRPKPGRPEGALPNLEEAQSESLLEREAPPPIPSTIRSPKSPPQPWNGRRVGDREAEGLDQTSRTDRGGAWSNISRLRDQKTRRAHALRPPSVLDDQFAQNFFTWALTRNPSSSETTYWYDQLRVGYAQGQNVTKTRRHRVGPNAV